MKKSTIIVVFLLIITILSGCRGNIKNVSIIDVKSDIYSEEDIKEAEKVVLDYFENVFEGCSLKELKYIGDEKNNDYMIFARRNGASEVMVFISNFDVGNPGAGGLNSNSTYTGWNWILIRNEDGKWEHVDHGY